MNGRDMHGIRYFVTESSKTNIGSKGSGNSTQGHDS